MDSRGKTHRSQEWSSIALLPKGLPILYLDLPPPDLPRNPCYDKSQLFDTCNSQKKNHSVISVDQSIYLYTYQRGHHRGTRLASDQGVLKTDIPVSMMAYTLIWNFDALFLPLCWYFL